MIGAGARPRSRSRSPIFKKNLERLPQRKWGKRIFTPGFIHGYFYRGGKDYTYPLWYYNNGYYPWWFAYRLGLMSTPMYNKFVKKYGEPLPAKDTDPQYPADLLDGRHALPIRAEIMEPISCEVCGLMQKETDLYHCAGCKEAIYCGVQCQKIAFETHKEECLF